MKLITLEFITSSISNEVDIKSFLEKLFKRFITNEKVETNTILTKLVLIQYRGKQNICEYILDMSSLVIRLRAFQVANVK